MRVHIACNQSFEVKWKGEICIIFGKMWRLIYIPDVRCARKRHYKTQILTSKFLAALRSQACKFYAIIYKSNSKSNLFYCHHAVLKMETTGRSETSLISTIHYVVSKHRITRPKSVYVCIVAGKIDFLFQELCKRLRLCGSNIKGVSDKPTNIIPFF